jgi:hypothetical protein
MQVQDVPQCRICFEPTGPLVCPCDCIGSGAYVHNHCLLRWYDAEPDRGLHCTVCKAELCRKMEEQSVVYGGPTLWRGRIYFDYSVQISLGWMESYLSIFGTVVDFEYTYCMGLALQVFHHLMIARYIFFSRYVHNKRAYYKQWCNRDMLLFLAIYGFVLGGMHRTSYLGNFTLKLLIVQLWKCHCAIVEHINQHIKPLEFINKRTSG